MIIKTDIFKILTKIQKGSRRMGNPALPLKITASKHFDVVDRKRSCILGEPVVDVQMVLDGPVPDSVDAALTEVLGSPVSTFWARTSPEIAIG